TESGTSAAPEAAESLDLAESGAVVTITGEALATDRLVDFTLDYAWTEGYVDKWYVGAFLDGLDDPAFKELYRRALALVRLFSTDSLDPADAVASSDDRARLEVEGELGWYLESGYTYESFRDAYYDVFTRETADMMFARYPCFVSYRGELWYKSTSAGGNVGEVWQEYELTEQSDTVLAFKRIAYSVPIGEPLEDYDPDKKDTYEKEEVSFRFVKTADGWRVEEFLNATDPERHMLIG
ncbi:MAG: hypothetical protein NC237_13230, partial [Eubacterium sp.]|nr:hypothetical protein [Eubacterium sp.]